MKKEYDFSGAERGKFYRPDAEVQLPAHLLEQHREVFERLLGKCSESEAEAALREILAARAE